MHCKLLPYFVLSGSVLQTANASMWGSHFSQYWNHIYLSSLYLMVWLRPHIDYKVSYATWVLLLIDLWFTNATKSLLNVLMLIYSVEEKSWRHILIRKWILILSFKYIFRLRVLCILHILQGQEGMFFFKYVYLSLTKPPLVAPHVSAINQNLC